MYSTPKIKLLLCLKILFLLALSGCGNKPSASTTSEAWDRANDPLNLGSQYEYRLNLLPSSAQVNLKPWTDTYWPSNKGGLANRWAIG